MVFHFIYISVTEEEEEIVEEIKAEEIKAEETVTKTPPKGNLNYIHVFIQLTLFTCHYVCKIEENIQYFLDSIANAS